MGPPGGHDRAEGEVTSEEVWMLTERSGFQFPVPPPFLQNHGNHVVSLSKMVRWMAAQIEAREVPGVDVMLLPGFAGMKVLWEAGKVVGVQTADKGVNADGTKKSNFEPGNNLKAKVTIFGEGPRGHLSRELDEVLNLQASAKNPQVYEMGVKEVWEVPEGNIEPGFVLHSTGWPLNDGESGGSWVYAMDSNRISIGYVVSLDTKDPFVDAHLILQKFKAHPRIAPMLAGGKMVQYGGKALAIGGWYSMPSLAFAGGMLVGDAAQMVNAARLKGIHLGMKGGMCAAETILSALKENDFSDKSLMRYSKSFMNSWAGNELYKARNFHASIEHGLTPGAALNIGFALATSGWVPGDPLKSHRDASTTQTTEAYYNKKGLKRDDLDWGVKFDGQKTFSKLDDVYLSGVWVAALERFARMADAMNEPALAAEARATRVRALLTLEKKFWIPARGQYAFAMLEQGKVNETMTAWPATAMAFGVLDRANGRRMAERMAASDLMTDWGARPLSATSPPYN